MQNFENDPRYQAAKKRVKKLKGFYIHASVFFLVNLFVISQNVREGASFNDMDNIWSAIFWGIGLLAHGLSVFGPNFIFGKDWEERKTHELMDKYK